MAAAYPAAIRTFTLKKNVTDINFAEHVNDLQEEITAMQRILGINPHGSYTDVISRLNGVDTSLANKAAASHTHASTGGGGTTNAVPLDGSVAMTGLLTLPAQNPTSNNHATRKKYVDDSISGLSFLVPFGQRGALAGSIGSLGALKIQGSSDTPTTNAASGFSLNYPNSFPTGLLVVVACLGDTEAPYPEGGEVTLIPNQCTKTGFGGVVHDSVGNPITNGAVRVNWVALGW